MRRVIGLRREEGVAMTEFALVLPVFLLLILGLVTFGQLFFYWIQTNHVASETARWAVVDRNPYKTCAGGATGQPGCRTLQQQAVDSSTSSFSSNARVCIDFPYPQAPPGITLGDTVRVRVQKPVGLKIKLPLMSPIDMRITVRGSSEMRIERFDSGTAPVKYSSADNIGTCS